MDYLKILQELENGLTGKVEHDTLYLKEKAQEYRGHKDSKEILRGIGRILYKLLPEEDKKVSDKVMAEGRDILDESYHQALNLAKQRDLLKAEEIMTVVLNSINGTFEPDLTVVYMNFDDAFQGSLYTEIYEEKREIRPLPRNHAAYYFFYGQLLIELARPEGAVTPLLKAVEFNPVNCQYLLELGDAFRRTGDLENFREVSLRALDVAIDNAQLARCYRDQGYYYIEKREYESAASLYWLSIYFMDSEMARTELKYIGEQIGSEPVEPSNEGVEKVCRDLRIPLGPNPKVIDTALTLGKLALQMNKKDLGEYCYQLAYDLTGDEKILELLDSLS